MSYAQLAFAECPSNVTAEKPVHLEWTGTQSVSTLMALLALSNSEPNILACKFGTLVKCIAWDSFRLPYQ